MGLHWGRAVKIGDRSCDAADLVVGAGRETKFRHCLAEQVDRRVVHGRVAVEPRARQLGIGVRHIYLSLDPYQRSMIAGRHGAAGPLGEGEMPDGEIVGQVVRSRHPDFADGEYVRHFGGWQNYSLSDGTQTFAVNPEQAPLSTFVGVLGMPGLTAYASMVDTTVRPAGVGKALT